MLKIGRNFQFEIPDGWKEVREGNRWIFHGPSAEELIVTSLFVEGEGSPSEQQEAEGELLEQALKAAEEAASQDGLTIVNSLARNNHAVGISSWSFISEASEESSLFIGGVFQHQGGVLFATLEGPNSPGLRVAFQRFITCVRAPKPDLDGV